MVLLAVRSTTNPHQWIVTRPNTGLARDTVHYDDLFERYDEADVAAVEKEWTRVFDEAADPLYGAVFKGTVQTVPPRGGRMSTEHILVGSLIARWGRFDRLLTTNAQRLKRLDKAERGFDILHFSAQSFRNVERVILQISGLIEQTDEMHSQSVHMNRGRSESQLLLQMFAQRKASR